ncbi:hypothetical protein EON64_00710 [archaeon]|nr:MAG: hypothetical protein EON64_00710 [archaeon]
MPDSAVFIQAYVDLVHRVQVDYPQSSIVAGCEPGSRGSQCANILSAAEQTGVHSILISNSVYEQGKGCDGHPSYGAQQAIAQQMAPLIGQLLAN